MLSKSQYPVNLLNSGSGIASLEENFLIEKTQEIAEGITHINTLGYRTKYRILVGFPYSTLNRSAPTYLIYIETLPFATVNSAPKDILPSFPSFRTRFLVVVSILSCIESLYRHRGGIASEGPKIMGRLASSPKQSATVPSDSKPLHFAAGRTTPCWNTKRTVGFCIRVEL